MAALRTAHTADLDRETLDAARTLLEVAFAGSWDEHDWEHCLGGVHALAWEGDELVGHGSVIQRRLLHRGRALRAGYVEGVGVRADRRRRGHAAAIMGALERVALSAYDLGALAATDAAVELYKGRGWQQWRGLTSMLTPAGIARTAAEDGAIYVLPRVAALDLSGELTCDWRDGDVW